MLIFCDFCQCPFVSQVPEDAWTMDDQLPLPWKIVPKNIYNREKNFIREKGSFWSPILLTSHDLSVTIRYMLRLASRKQILTRLAGKVQLIGCGQGEQFMFQQGVGRKLVNKKSQWCQAWISGDTIRGWCVQCAQMFASQRSLGKKAQWAIYLKMKYEQADAGLPVYAYLNVLFVKLISCCRVRYMQSLQTRLRCHLQGILVFVESESLCRNG